MHDYYLDPPILDFESKTRDSKEPGTYMVPSGEGRTTTTTPRAVCSDGSQVGIHVPLY